MQESKFIGLDMNSIINSHSAWPLNKALATKVQLQGIFPIGDWIKILDDDDILFVSHAITNTTYDDNDAAELYLMSMLLSIAEGLELIDDERMDRRFDALIVFLTCESLRRKGMVELHHDKMSLGEDSGQLEFVKATPEGLQLIASILGREDDQAG